MLKLSEKSSFKENFKKAIKKAAKGFKSYICDWKNLVVHAVIGIILVVIAIWAPINIWIKLGIFVCVIIFNIWRMRRAACKKKEIYSTEYNPKLELENQQDQI